MLNFVILGTVDIGVLFILILWKTCVGRKRERRDINRVVVCTLMVEQRQITPAALPST